MTPLFFIPNCPVNMAGDSKALPVETGLVELLDGLNLEGGASSGPGGATGLLLSPYWPNDLAKRTPWGYNDKEQEWFPVRPLGKEVCYHVGWPKGKPPGPADLQRSVPINIAGHKVKCLDGNKWVIPLLGPPGAVGTKYSAVPTAFGWFEETGDLGIRYPRKWIPVCTESAIWYDRVKSGKLGTSFMEIAKFAAMLLNVNYAVDLGLILSCFELFDTSVFSEMLRVALGGVEIMEEQSARGKEEAAAIPPPG